MQLSNNFTLGELTKSELAVRKQIDNEPSQAVIVRLMTLTLALLQPLREKLGKPLVITSGYRSPKLNKATGGSETSQHCKGEAADFECPGMDNKELAKFIKKNYDFDQLILEFYEDGKPDSGWVHCSFVSDHSNRHQCLTAKLRGGKTVYAPWKD